MLLQCQVRPKHAPATQVYKLRSFSNTGITFTADRFYLTYSLKASLIKRKHSAHLLCLTSAYEFTHQLHHLQPRTVACMYPGKPYTEYQHYRLFDQQVDFPIPIGQGSAQSLQVSGNKAPIFISSIAKGEAVSSPV